MIAQRFTTFTMLTLLGYGTVPVVAAELPIESLPKDDKQAKIVLIAGSNFFKPGEHDYIAGCSVLHDLLAQTEGVAPVLALDWPKKPETLAGARAVVFMFDGAEKSKLLKDDHLARIQKLADSGVGLVQLHQVVDFPKDLGDRARGLCGAAWESGFSQRAHWVGEFKDFGKHPIFQGVAPFKINDGWLFKLRFVPELKGVTPLLRTVAPKSTIDADSNDAIVGWAYDRGGVGRSFSFTGCHLHASFAQEGYRRFLVNGILWSANLKIPEGGAAVSLTDEDMNKYLQKPPTKAK
jgi:trehalose utilization protein